MKWKVKVTNVNSRLRVRTGPSTSYRVVDWQPPTGTGVVVDTKTVNGETWYKWEGTEYWSCGKTSSGTVYLTKVEDLEQKPAEPTVEDKKKPAEVPPEKEKIDVTLPDYGTNRPISANPGGNNLNNNLVESSWYQPMQFGRTQYNEVSDSVIARNIAALKYNMDIGYKDANEVYDGFESERGKGYFASLQRKLYNSFNRNKVAFPDKELPKTFAYVFFTRPDLNILKQGASASSFSLNSQVNVDGKYEYLWKNNPWCLRSLVSNGNPHHKFLVLLSNEALSFEVGDTVLKTIEHGETYNGNKIIYGKSDQESTAAGELSVRYIDTVNLDIFKLHLAWTDYINKVSRGIFSPKAIYMKNKIIDYAASCYYFLCGPDGSTILYWQKLTGVFPVNTSENTFSWDSGTLLAKPEINIKYMYSFRSSMDVISLMEFNDLIKSNSVVEKVTYDSNNLHTGSTLTHAPYIKGVDVNEENTEGRKIYRLIWLENK